MVMERFLMQQAGRARLQRAPRTSARPGFATPPLPGVPPVLRDHLIVPYLAGRDFVRALHERGGWPAVRKAWTEPSAIDRAGAAPREVPRARRAARRRRPDAPPAGGRLIQEGVLGEALTRTLLGEGSDAAAAGWGGDLYQVWDVGGRTLVVWRTEWDTRGRRARVPRVGARGASPAATAGRGGCTAPTSSAAAAGTWGSRRATEGSPWWRATTPARSTPRSRGRRGERAFAAPPAGSRAMIFVVCLALLVLGEGSVAAARHAQGLTGTPAAQMCSFRARTGAPCLGCGGTEAFGHAARGRFLSAVVANPLGAWSGATAWALLVASGLTLAGGGTRRPAPGAPLRGRHAAGGIRRERVRVVGVPAPRLDAGAMRAPPQ